MEDYRFAGFRILEFSGASREALQEIAERLLPYETAILETWVAQQLRAWEPPGFSREALLETFGQLWHAILVRLQAGQAEKSLDDLEELGGVLADQDFPYEALIMSFHFLEESYMAHLLFPRSDHIMEWLVSMDEFLHAALAALATSYFQSYRRELLAQAEIGRIVQEQMLAHIPVQVADLEVGQAYRSAREGAQVGGDLFDLLAMDAQGAAFIVADVSGKGLEAASDSVMVRSLFRSFLHENPELGDVMERMNSALTAEFADGNFATAQAGIYSSPGRLLLSSAGHPHPVICDSGGACRFLDTEGMALGIRPGTGWAAQEIELEPGALFVAYTDGLLEARGPDGFFGEERILACIEEVREAPARAVADHLIDTAMRHAGGKLADDVAILVLKRQA